MVSARYGPQRIPDIGVRATGERQRPRVFNITLYCTLTDLNGTTRSRYTTKATKYPMDGRLSNSVL